VTLFSSDGASRLFALPNGVDFPVQLIAGLTARLTHLPPDAMARTTLLVNTSRMKRRLHDLLVDGPAGLLPQLRLLTDLSSLPGAQHVPLPAPRLRRRLELTQLISILLDRQPDLASRSSLYDLADSLASLMEEMQGEAVPAKAIRDLDVTDLSGHWARAQAFFDIADQFVSDDDHAPDTEGHQRAVVESLIAHWQHSPPTDPVIMAGSTASRGTTLLLMEAVAKLPQGAIVLPGYDFDQPASVWQNMIDKPNEDHPQFRFVKLMQRLDIGPDAIKPWTDAAPASQTRNKLISLALRPAPVTDAWMREGPELTGLGAATEAVTLLEAPSPRDEALAIAMRLRQAAQDGQTAALITPDRMLTRRVTAALQRWDILPDDSAGTPLHLSAPGRFLRLVARLELKFPDAAQLLTLLKHPLTHSGIDRGPHLRLTREFELHVRRKSVPFPDALHITEWAAARPEADAQIWAEWVCDTLCAPPMPAETSLFDRVTNLCARAERLSAGPQTADLKPADPDAARSGQLWQKQAGKSAQTLMGEFTDAADAGGILTAAAFSDMLGAVLSGGQIRDRDAPHPNIMMWGTLEARVGGTDLVILGGLNEGSWPEPAQPDPWLNRQMRRDAGLLLPERRIGLSAHDFQQAIAAGQVWLTRALKSDDSETVPSRWLNRITNLLAGLDATGGASALKDMRARADHWLSLADAIEHAPRLAAATRPAPRPPMQARPRQLSITEIKTLIRDPYAIYAKRVLRLRPLNPLVKVPDALLRGILVHKVLEVFVKSSVSDPNILAKEHLLSLTSDILDAQVPWATTRAQWFSRMANIADGFLKDEIDRQRLAKPTLFETALSASIADLGFTLTGQADRVDIQDNGQLRIYDYKTGKPPTGPEQSKFDKQLLIEAVIATQGGFHKHAYPSDVAEAAFLGVGTDLATVSAPLRDEPLDKVWSDLHDLLSAYLSPEQGFTSRRMAQKDARQGDFDHLARFGEWDRADIATPEDLT
jgi:double-strand break repair protein AddB